MPAVAVEIVECHRDFVVAFKAAGIHSAPLRPEDGECALALVAAQFPEVRAVQGRKAVEGGLVHRIDQDTAGLLLIARNQGFYDHIMACQEAGLFKKGYTARCQYLPSCPDLLGGFPPPPNLLGFPVTRSTGFMVESGFRPYGPGRKQVRPVTEQSGKFSQRKAGGSKQGSSPLYSTELSITKTHGKNFVVEASITKGYRHQVRCHLAWCGLPIIGDPLYNPTKKSILQVYPDSNPINTDTPAKQSSQQMQFFATSLSFPAFSSSEILSFTICPDEI